MSPATVPASINGLPHGRRRLLWMLLATLPLLEGCAGSSPPLPSVALPPDAVEGAGDPTRSAIINASFAFANVVALVGRLDEAARAVANYEYLAVEIPTGPRWVGFSPLVGLELRRGLAEVRSAVGIAPAAPPQLVVDALHTVIRASRAGDAEAATRALQPPLFEAGGEATLTRLGNLPRLPREAFATTLALNEMNRQDRDRGRRGFWPSF